MAFCVSAVSQMQQLSCRLSTVRLLAVDYTGCVYRDIPCLCPWLFQVCLDVGTDLTACQLVAKCHVAAGF